MTKKDKPLPKPPTRAFGRKKMIEEEEQTALMADRMAAAAAEGKLDEFLKQEMPDNEFARNLANLMMGMTGMATGIPAPPEVDGPDAGGEKIDSASSEVPEDITRAIQGGNVQEMMALLRREHHKRHPEAAAAGPVKEKQNQEKPADAPAIDKAFIDALIRIAQENSVSLDWIILRAIKVYVEEYKKTGKL